MHFLLFSLNSLTPKIWVYRPKSSLQEFHRPRYWNFHFQLAAILKNGRKGQSVPGFFLATSRISFLGVHWRKWYHSWRIMGGCMGTPVGLWTIGLKFCKCIVSVNRPNNKRANIDKCENVGKYKNIGMTCFCEIMMYFMYFWTLWHTFWQMWKRR